MSDSPRSCRSLRDGVTSDERARLKELERGNCELRRADDILRKASAYIENAVRTLVQLFGGSPFSTDSRRGARPRTPGPLLNDRCLDHAFGEASENVLTRLQVLLAEPRGSNLRNNVCHEVFPDAAFTARASSSRVCKFRPP